jgi:hypothetical protein
VLAVLSAATAVAFALAGSAAASSLSVDRVFPGVWEVAECTEGGAQARCFLVDVGGLVPGLGRVAVHERVLQSGDVGADLCEPQVRYGTITTPRGAIEYLARGIDCPATRELNGGYRAVVVEWEVVAGTGAYVGVTGGGAASVRPEEDAVFLHFHGALEVPGLEFDTTPPVFSGAPGPIAVRSGTAASVRYKLPAAVDATDGAVPVTCAPASGSRFRVGRTIVRCQAVDASGNVAAASFAVVVGGGKTKARR